MRLHPRSLSVVTMLAFGSVPALADPMTVTHKAAPQPAPQQPAPQRPAPQTQPGAQQPAPAQPRHGHRQDPVGQTPPPNAQAPSPQAYQNPYNLWNGTPQTSDGRGSTGRPGSAANPQAPVPQNARGAYRTGMVANPPEDPAQDGVYFPPTAVAGEGNGGNLSLSGEQLVQLMGDNLYSQDGREAAANELLQGGLEGVPALLTHLGDKRVFVERGGADNITVGQACDSLLYAMVTPGNYRSPQEPKGAHPPQRFFKVEDWNGFFKARQGKSIQAIRQELHASIDAYWSSGGTVQSVK